MNNADVVVEKEIAMQCAPVILGLKTANLLVLNQSQKGYADRIFRNTELSLYPLCSYEDKMYYLLYQPWKLEQYIQEFANTSYLSELGYLSMENESVVEKIAYKYNKYMMDRKEFPHEIGLLLGYPLNDVLNFIAHNGTQYLYSGYWKVYDNLTETLLVFQRYHKARKILYEFLIHGGRIKTVINEIIRYD